MKNISRPNLDLIHECLDPPPPYWTENLTQMPSESIFAIFKVSIGTNFINISWFLAHLSRRLIGELIVYPWSGVRRRTSSVVRSQCSNIFFSETAWPIKAKFYVEPPWVEGTKFCSRHLGHMTKMAATPIYGKNPSKIFFSRTGGPIFTKLGM